MQLRRQRIKRDEIDFDVGWHCEVTRHCDVGWHWGRLFRGACSRLDFGTGGRFDRLDLGSGRRFGRFGDGRRFGNRCFSNGRFGGSSVWLGLIWPGAIWIVFALAGFVDFALAAIVRFRWQCGSSLALELGTNFVPLARSSGVAAGALIARQPAPNQSGSRNCGNRVTLPCRLTQATMLRPVASNSPSRNTS